jgi:hypothetical protein
MSIESPLLRLSAELRNESYALVLSSPTPLLPSRYPQEQGNIVRPDSSITGSNKLQPTQVCQQADVLGNSGVGNQIQRRHNRSAFSARPARGSTCAVALYHGAKQALLVADNHAVPPSNHLDLDHGASRMQMAKKRLLFQILRAPSSKSPPSATEVPRSRSGMCFRAGSSMAARTGVPPNHWRGSSWMRYSTRQRYVGKISAPH